jgi:drug/metabolite transporter (DMT)-like permease
MKYAFIAAVISGFSIYTNKFAVAAVPPPVLFTTLKNLIVGVAIFGLIIVAGKINLLKNLSKKNLLGLLVIGVIGGAIPFYLFFTGLSQIPAVNGAIIQKTLVIWVTILAVPILKEKLTLTNLLAVSLLFYANVFIGGFKGFTFSNGELMILTATLLWSVETIIIKKINYDPDIVALFRMGFGSLILLTISPTNQITNLGSYQWFWVLGTSGVLFAYVFFWLRALKNAPAVSVTSILAISTLITNLLSSKFSFSQTGLMTIGVLLLLTPHYSSALISRFRSWLKI